MKRNRNCENREEFQRVLFAGGERPQGQLADAKPVCITDNILFLECPRSFARREAAEEWELVAWLGDADSAGVPAWEGAVTSWPPWLVEAQQIFAASKAKRTERYIQSIKSNAKTGI